MNATVALHAGREQRAAVTLALCFLIAVIEGMDLQSMGIAAPALGPEFHLSRQQLGLVLLASPLGLFFGAFIGGRIADAWGRKYALVLATALFGALQLGTTWATGMESLLVIRFLCGLGLGGAFPNLIALTAEASGGRNSIINVVITVAGMPAGGALASLIGFLGGEIGDWRVVFYVGGIAPLALAPAMALALPESSLFRAAKAAAAAAGTKHTTLEVLFGGARAGPTVLLWSAVFFTTLVTYLLLNWMPVLMGAKGFSKTDALLIQILFNVGAALGSVYIGWIMQRRPRPRVLLICYAGLAAGLLVMAPLGKDLLLAASAAALVGACVLGAQFVLFGLAPAYYAVETRGTGTGACVAASRLGSAIGPFFAGMLLGQGASATHVLQALLPVTGAAAAAAIGLLSRRSAAHTPIPSSLLLALMMAAPILGFAGRCWAGPPAGAGPVVVELFTSQGCSSCPPADALLGELAGRRNVIALAFHVDYWDSLGWRDRFSMAAATLRQNSYVEALRMVSAFTPQVVIGGSRSFVGSDRQGVQAAVAQGAATGVAVEATVAGDELVISLPDAGATGSCDVELIAYLPQATTLVGRGENSGRTLTDFNIVREFRRLGAWSGKAFTWRVPLKSLPSDATRAAVLVQQTHQGSIAAGVAINLR